VGFSEFIYLHAGSVSFLVDYLASLFEGGPCRQVFAECIYLHANSASQRTKDSILLSHLMRDSINFEYFLCFIIQCTKERHSCLLHRPFFVDSQYPERNFLHPLQVK
jgi:hypothetical protein